MVCGTHAGTGARSEGMMVWYVGPTTLEREPGLRSEGMMVWYVGPTTLEREAGVRELWFGMWDPRLNGSQEPGVRE